LGKIRLDIQGSIFTVQDNIKKDLLEIGMNVWTGLVWLRIGTGGELL
jgi:hypothetical protein